MYLRSINNYHVMVANTSNKNKQTFTARSEAPTDKQLNKIKWGLLGASLPIVGVAVKKSSLPLCVLASACFFAGLFLDIFVNTRKIINNFKKTEEKN